MINLKRANQPAAVTHGRRFLVDRVWPRGRQKENLQIEAWPLMHPLQRFPYHVSLLTAGISSPLSAS